MTTRTILLTLAASMAPLYAQQAPAPVPAAQIFSALAAPAPQTEAATPEQRAQVFNALALLPQNISDFAVLTNVGGNLLRLAESGKLPEFSADDLSGEILQIDNIALASTPATPATYALLQHVLVSLGTLNSSVQLATDWAPAMRPELTDALMESLLLHADSCSNLPEGATEGTHIPASYAVITCKPGAESILQECAGLLLAELRESGKPGISPVDEANGFSGIRMNVVETYANELAEATSNMAPRRKEELLAALAKHPVHILVRQQGQALIIALCENPQELSLAATPAQSLLATNKLAPCDANLGKGMIAASHVSPELSAVGNAFNSQPTINLAGGIRAVFSRLAEQEPDNKAVYEKAAAAVSFIGAELQKLARPVTQPSFMQMWCDGDLHIVLSGDAQGCSYHPGTLRLAPMADEPKTSLYAETTPMHMGEPQPDSQALVDAAFSVAEGFTLTLGGEDREQTAAALAALNNFAPELRALAAAGSTVCSGLDGQLALVMDSALTPIPTETGAQPGTQADAPRLALYAGVKERSKLTEGWEAMRASAGQVAVKLGMPAEIINMLPIASRQEGAAMSYSIALPFFTQDAVPSLAVTDTGLALGSSVNLTTQVVNSATGTLPMAGAAFALKFKPLSRTLRSMATALDHNAEEAQPAASSEVRLEKENSAPVAVIRGEDGPTSVFISMETADADDTADTLSTAAAITEFAASIAEGVYGTSTIENGQHIIRIQLRMK